jgi:NAD(P)-dependent dehydrogenase (short-subunit alcohol dehydrogenase family)
MGEWSGRVAFITGGSQGIGRAAAELFASEGASVAVCGLEPEIVEATVRSIVDAGGAALAVPANVADAGSIGAAVETAVRRYGRLDVLVTSAGIQRYGTVGDTDEATWDEVFAVNVKGVFLAAHAAIPHLRATGQGAVVVVSSVQGHAAQEGVVAYAATKGALDAFVRAMAVDEAPYGVRVNAVCPGSVDTPMLRTSAGLFSEGTPQGIEATLGQWGRMHPAGRVAEPREVAEVIAFLASPRASFVSGVDVRVDGALLATLPVRLPE